MTKLEALQQLAEKVEAGATGRDIDRSLVWLAFGRELRPHGEPIGRIIDCILDPEDMRAMGAVLSLHNAVLPEWGWSFYYDGECGVQHTTRNNWAFGVSDTPARAWLLAILRALIAIEQQNTGDG